jgi:hypothetical protein
MGGGGGAAAAAREEAPALAERTGGFDADAGAAAEFAARLLPSGVFVDMVA